MSTGLARLVGWAASGAAVLILALGLFGLAAPARADAEEDFLARLSSCRQSYRGSVIETLRFAVRRHTQPDKGQNDLDDNECDDGGPSPFAPVRPVGLLRPVFEGALTVDFCLFVRHTLIKSGAPRRVSLPFAIARRACAGGKDYEEARRHERDPKNQTRGHVRYPLAGPRATPTLKAR